MNKRFKNDRFITKGVEENLNPLLIILLWEMIDNLTVSQDYLQVFNLSEEDGKQRIEHIQEQPEYRREYVFNLNTKVNGKVFVIDDKTHSIMLMNYEY